MKDYLVMRAVEFDKLPSKFKKLHKDELHLVDEFGYWLQKKYDGCMGIAEMWPEHLGNSRMLSRTGEDYTSSCGHLLKEIANAAFDQDPNWQPFIVIGEVWQPFNEAKFPAISGKFRRQSPSPELRFAANDLLPMGFNTEKPYYQRFSDMRALLGDVGEHDDTFKVFIAQTFDDGELNPNEAALQWQAEGGFDGGIIRNADAGYTVGTVKNGEIVKVKPTLSLDLEIIRTDRAEGEKTGRDVYTLVVQYKGVTSFVGSGVPHVLSWSAGDIAEIECLGITEDGKLREPRFKGIRHDKLKPDA